MCAVEITPVVSTERLILRGPVVTDAAAIAGLVNDRNVAGMTGMIPHPYGLADAEAFIARAQAIDWARDANWVIEHQAFGVVGGLGFKGGGARPEIGFWLGRPFWNRGYATEAVRGARKGAKATGAGTWSSPATSPTTPRPARCSARPVSSTPATSNSAPGGGAAGRTSRPG